MSKQAIKKDMTAEELSKVLKSLIRAAKTIRKYALMDSIGEMELTAYFCTGIDNNPEIHLYRGAHWAAELLGIPYTVVDRDDEDYPYKGFFEYNGFRFFELLTEKEEVK